MGKDKPKFRVIQGGVESPLTEEEIRVDADVEEVEFERRAEKRKRLNPDRDWPLTRKIIGSLIIAGTLYYGYRSMSQYHADTAAPVESPDNSSEKISTKLQDQNLKTCLGTNFIEFTKSEYVGFDDLFERILKKELQTHAIVSDVVQLAFGSERKRIQLIVSKASDGTFNSSASWIETDDLKTELPVEFQNFSKLGLKPGPSFHEAASKLGTVLSLESVYEIQSSRFRGKILETDHQPQQVQLQWNDKSAKAKRLICAYISKSKKFSCDCPN